MTGNQSQFKYLMNQGHSAAWDQSWEKAAAFYRQALAEYPDHLTGLINLGLALFELKDYPEASKIYQKAALVSPDDPIPQEKVAEIYERMGILSQAVKSHMDVAELYARNRDISKAIKKWLKVIQLNPLYIAAHSRLALVYERIGRPQEAVEHLITIGGLFQHYGEFDKAISSINHAIQLQPDNVNAHRALNLLNAGTPIPLPSANQVIPNPGEIETNKDQEYTLPTLDEQPQGDPIFEAKRLAISLLANYLFEQKSDPNHSQPHQELQSIVDGSSVTNSKNEQMVLSHLRKALGQQSQGNDINTISELERAISVGMENPAAYFLVGLLLTNISKFDNAVKYLQKSVTNDPFKMASHLLLGIIYTSMHKNSEAASEFLEALRLAELQQISREQQDELNQVVDSVADGLSIFNDENNLIKLCTNIKNLIISPDWRDKIITARRQLPEQPSGSPPISLVEMLLETDNNQIVESLARVRQYAQNNNFRTAMEEAYFAISLAPTYLPLHICIGDLLIKENRISDAVKKYCVVADSYLARGAINKAIDLLKRVSEYSPMDSDARNRLIELLIANHRYDDTVKELIDLAQTYYSYVDLDMAYKTYTRALQLAQANKVETYDTIYILHQLADIKTQNLDWREALRIFDQIRSLRKDDEKANYMLVELNLKLNQPEKAFEELDKNISYLLVNNQLNLITEILTSLTYDFPIHPELHLRLAEIYQKQGMVDMAIDHLDACIEICTRLGNKNAAVTTIQKIIELDPAQKAKYQELLYKLLNQNQG